MQSASTWDSQKEVDLSIKSLESHYSKEFYIFCFHSILKCMIYLHWMGNMVLHITTLGFMWFTLKQFAIYIRSCMTALLSEEIFYVCAQYRIKSPNSLLLTEKWRPFTSSLASVALRITLQSAGQICLEALCADEVYFVTLDLNTYREQQRGEPCLNGPFLVMLHPGRL